MLMISECVRMGKYVVHLYSVQLLEVNFASVHLEV